MHLRSASFLFAAAVATLSCTSHDPGRPNNPGVDTGPIDSGPFVPDSCKASLSQPAEVVVGKGQTFYSELADNEVLTWEKGPQGGHHVWIALRVIGVRQQGTITTIDLDDLDIADPAKNPINHSRVVYDFNRDEGGHCTLPGLRMQLDNAGSVALSTLVNHHIRVTATVQDPDGAKTTSAKTIIVTGTTG
jgi:hypothetical protein